MKTHRHNWASLLAKTKNKVISVPLARVCLQCGEMKIGKKTIRISRFRLDMGNKQIKNLAAPTAATDAARLQDAAGGPVNRGRYWVAHGDNVITFPTAHSSSRYRWIATVSFAPMGGITTRNNPHTQPLAVSLSNESPTRGKIRIDGGFGFSTCGSGPVGTTERFDDVANTHTARTAATARWELAGYSLNGFGFSTCGWTGVAIVGTTERFDDVANTHTARTAATARQFLSGYSLNGFGFSTCGLTTANVGTTERFDDVANTHTARTAATARRFLAGYSLNGFGFSTCGFTTTDVGTTERFDDVANTHTARTAATARHIPAGYSTNEYFVNYVTFNE